MIQQDNGIEFAQHTVQVRGDEKSATAAAATSTIMRKKVAETVEGQAATWQVSKKPRRE